MANKSNIRSFRYSDEIACILNQQIEQRRQVLHNLENATEELNRLEKDILAAKNSFCIVARRAAAIAEKADNL